MNKESGLNWLLLDLNSFFATCEQQHNPALRGKPVGVVPMTGVDTTCLIAASQEAKQFGLKTGTPVSEARRICRDIVLLKANHNRYVTYHHKILTALDRHLPIEQVLSIDEMACRLTGSQRDLVKALTIAKAIKQEIRHEAGDYLTCSIGLAPNRLVAKMASDMKKPDGLVAIMPHDLPHALYHLPLQAVPGIGPNMLRRLHDANIKDMKTFCESDPRWIRQVWGSVHGVRTWAQLNGQDVPPVETTHKSVIGHQHVLEPELRTREKSYDVLHYLLVKAAERLRKMDHTCSNLSVSVKFTNHYGKWRQDTRFHPTSDTLFLLAQLKTMWEQYPDQALPLRVGVSLHGLSPIGHNMDDLFTPDHSTPLFTAVDKVNSAFGRHAVTFGLNNYVREKVGTDKIAFARVPEEETL
jgi:DNA polymerase-4